MSFANPHTIVVIDARKSAQNILVGIFGHLVKRPKVGSTSIESGSVQGFYAIG